MDDQVSGEGRGWCGPMALSPVEKMWEKRGSRASRAKHAYVWPIFPLSLGTWVDTEERVWEEVGAA